MIEDSPNSRTNLSEIGEFGLIELLTKNLGSKLGSTIKGIGDDAAVIDHGSNQIILTTDLLVEGVHFDLAYMP